MIERRIGSIALIAALAGCGAYSTYRTTRIASRDHTELVLGVQATGFAVPDGTPAPLPELAVAARRGVTEQLELQLNTTLVAIEQFGTGSVELGAKLRVLERGRWSAAIGANVGYRLAESGAAVIEGAHVAVPLIAGVELGAHQLVASITGGYQRWYSSGARPVAVPFVGPSFGFVWQVGRRWALLPELGWAFTPTPNVMASDSRLFHVGIGAVWRR